MILLLATFLAAAAPPAAGAPIAEGDVRALVDRWLTAQNSGDLAAYDKLFAARFTGIRRSGPRTVRFDRAGWMKDRARMFGKPTSMTVAISDVRIRIVDPTALVSFTQTFAQGNYKDAGPKQLLIVREAGVPKIAGEFMMRSEIAASSASAGEDFRFVVSGAVLLSDSPDLAWGTGPITFDPNAGDPAVAAQRVDIKKLPPELARWQMRRVRLITVNGGGCEGGITGFRLLSRSIPHFGTRQAWREPGVSPAVVARQAWDAGAKVLVGDTDKSCEDTHWARTTGRPILSIDQGAPADDTLKARALAELRRSDAWKAIQKSYLEEPKKNVARWDQLDGVTVDVRRFRAWRGGKEIRLVSATLIFYNGCAEFGGELEGLFEERGPKLVPRNTPGKTDAYPISVFDSDGDGNSELLMEAFPSSFGHEWGRATLDGELWDAVEMKYVPFLDCPC